MGLSGWPGGYKYTMGHPFFVPRTFAFGFAVYALCASLQQPNLSSTCPSFSPTLHCSFIPYPCIPSRYHTAFQPNYTHHFLTPFTISILPFTLLRSSVLYAYAAVRLSNLFHAYIAILVGGFVDASSDVT
ncbi:hypothetical protein ACSQ67_000685 [Phaseolus vulgaris]